MKTFLPRQKRSQAFFSTFLHNVQHYTQKVIMGIGLVATTSLGQQSQPSHLGPFQYQLRSENPLREPIHFASRPNPVAVDLDKDGDRDVVVADFYGGNGFYFLRNDGNASSPTFNYAKYYDNPFYYQALGNGGTPAFSDMDKDGDLDMLLGLIDGTLKYYRNNSTRTNAFTQQTGVWNSGTKAGNPFNGVDLGDYAAPVFIDFDKDGDDDVIIGTSYLPNNKSIHYYVNDGEGNFTQSSLQGVNPATDETTPALIDVDSDGLIDILTGAADGSINFFKRTGNTDFVLQAGSANPFNGINRGIHNSPTTADFDGDSDLDLIFGVESIDQDLYYYENKGNGTFQERTSFENPFGGVTVVRNATPYFIDLNRDGNKELIIASWYGSQKLKVLEFSNGGFKESSNNPFTSLTFPNNFYPSFVDIDNDGDIDVIGGADTGTGNAIEFYKNDAGNYVRQALAGGPFSAITIDEGKADFVDIDADGDYDLFISDYTTDGYLYNYFLRFYKNTGSKESPVFSLEAGTANPLASVSEQFAVFPRFIDVDHDGDFDAVIGEGGDVIEGADGNEFSLYENTGSSTTPVFTYRGDLIQQGDGPTDPAPSFFDVDSDGDLDMFVGGLSGDISFYKNNNPAASIAVNSSTLNIAPSAAAVAIDNTLTLTDSDSDSLVFAVVTIGNYQQGRQIITHTPQSGISGTFDANTGSIRFIGKAPLSTYQVLLRSVKVEYREGAASGRTSATATTFTVTIEVSDADGTRSTPASRSVAVVTNQAPVFADATASVKIGGSTAIDLKTLITDVDNNVQLSTLAVVQSPASGANVGIDSDGLLSLNYSSLSFTGTENVVVKVCDFDGACDQSTVTVNVVNSAPVFGDGSASTTFGKTASIDLTKLVSDAENNIQWSTLTITSGLGSTASTNVDGNHLLTINYAGKVFSGTETLVMRVCDTGGSCDSATMSITVVNTPPAFNSTTVTISFGQKATIDLVGLASDAENNIDFSTAAVVQQPSSGAKVTVDSNQKLTVDYSGAVFAGIDQIGLKICDQANSCATNTITVNVTNTAPVITSQNVSVKNGSSARINLANAIVDAENNLAWSSLNVISANGALTSLENTSGTQIDLVLDYRQVSFTGTDEITIRICDIVGVCAESVVFVNVEGGGEVEVFNAVAPSSSGDNRYMRIINLPASNNVKIFNRWGDEVFAVSGYDSEVPGKRFEGVSSVGNALTTGTYFYKIEYFNSANELKTLTGYLSLKQ